MLNLESDPRSGAQKAINNEQIAIRTYKTIKNKGVVKLKRRKGKLFLGLLLIFVIAIMGYVVINQQNDKNYKQSVLETMEERYGEEFEVLDSRYGGTSFTRIYKVHSLTTGLYFDAEIFLKEDSDRIKFGTIKDDYGMRRTEYEFEENFRPVIENYFKGRVDFTAGFNTIDKVNYKTEFYNWVREERKSKGIVDYVALMEQNKGEVDHIGVNMVYVRDMNEENINELFEEVYEYFMYLKELRVKSTILRIIVVDEIGLKDSEIIQEIDKGSSLLNLTTELRKSGYYKYNIGYESLNLEDVNSVEDVIKDKLKMSIDYKNYENKEN